MPKTHWNVVFEPSPRGTYPTGLVRMTPSEVLGTYSTRRAAQQALVGLAAERAKAIGTVVDPWGIPQANTAYLPLIVKLIPPDQLEAPPAHREASAWVRLQRLPSRSSSEPDSEEA